MVDTSLPCLRHTPNTLGSKPAEIIGILSIRDWQSPGNFQRCCGRRRRTKTQAALTFREMSRLVPRELDRVDEGSSCGARSFLPLGIMGQAPTRSHRADDWAAPLFRAHNPLPSHFAYAWLRSA